MGLEWAYAHLRFCHQNTMSHEDMNKKPIDPDPNRFRSEYGFDGIKIVCGEWQIIAFMLIYCNSFGQMQNHLLC